MCRISVYLVGSEMAIHDKSFRTNMYRGTVKWIKENDRWRVKVWLWEGSENSRRWFYEQPVKPKSSARCKCARKRSLRAAKLRANANKRRKKNVRESEKQKTRGLERERTRGGKLCKKSRFMVSYELQWNITFLFVKEHISDVFRVD